MSNTIVRSVLFFVAVSSITLTLIGTAHAGEGTDVGVMLGVKDAMFTDSMAGSPTFTSEAGVMVGAIATGSLANSFYFRSGGYFTQRVAQAQLQGTATITLSYLEIPITGMYKFNDMIGVFAGLSLGLKVADNCSGNSTICTTSGDGYTSPSSFVTSGELGVNVKFHPNWSGELFYDLGLSNVATSTSASSLSAGIMFIY